MSAPPPPRERRSRLLPAVLILLLVGGGIAAYYFWPKPNVKPVEDMAGAMAANLRGVGLIEQYKYMLAAQEFEEASRLAPEWLPARINLAIALMNENKVDTKARAEGLLRDALNRDPDSRHAHFCLGIVLYDRTKLAEAHEHFAIVNRLDPEDAHAWLRMGSTHPNGSDSPEARKCFEESLKRNPYLNAARYGLFMSLRGVDQDRALKLLADFESLKAADWEHLSRILYTEMGKYADAIGRDPKATGKPVIGPLPMFESPSNFKVVLALGARWATAADLDPIRKAARERFGATIVLFDYNRDGKPDVFMTSAVFENGKVRDLLLKNDGNNTYTDVTTAAGLATPRPSLGAAAADYDNDGQLDLVITGAGEQHIFRNKGDGKFEDETLAVGLDQVKGVCLGCGWADLDQDGDLDLILCRYAESIEAAGLFSTVPTKPTGGVEVFENIGVYPPGQLGPLAGLTTKFRADDRVGKTLPPCSPTSIVITDIDHDFDLDLLVLADGLDPIVVENDRIMRFKRATPKWASGIARRWNGGLVLDANHDERSDLFLIAADGPPVLLLSKNERDFEAAPTNSPQLKQALAVDLDRDSWTDVTGLGVDGKAVLLHNQGDGRLERKADAFGDAPPSIGLVVANLDENCTPDLLLQTDAGVQFRGGMDNGNAAVIVEPTGQRMPRAQKQPGPARTNTDGIGCWITAYAGSTRAEAERTTVSAGLGQSMLPTSLGIGTSGRAESVRIRWPDMVYQTELGINGCSVFRVSELERKPDSCPTLMTWDGEKFTFVTDILGGGALGELEADGSVRPPRPEESVKIEHWQMKPRNGKYVLKVAEPMDEVLYLDRLRLDVVDHPAGVEVFPDERFATMNPQPTQELLAFKKSYIPKLATDHRGTDVTKLLLERDRKMVEGFALRSWLGFAEDHSLTLDFGEILPVKPGGKWHLVLAGWTEYAYPESLYAAARAGVALNVPVLERLSLDGKTWEKRPLGELGFPAGLPRVMTCPIPNFRPGKCVLRIRTNMQVYWDQIYLAQAEDMAATSKVTPLEVASADIAYRGFMQEVFPDGRPPVSYDDAKTESVTVTKWKGNLTRIGDVTELLRAFDDRFVICGPGDEIMVRFDATKLPELPTGWQRSFVLRSAGYCKSVALTTATGGVVGPLPFKAMPNYPDFGLVKPPITDADRWHTRPASGK